MKEHEFAHVKRETLHLFQASKDIANIVMKCNLFRTIGATKGKWILIESKG